MQADFVIVGAGSAGCVLANRLTEDPNTKVLLIAAGGRDRNPLIHVPAGFMKMLDHPTLTWKYRAEPDAGTNGRAIVYTRGRVSNSDQDYRATEDGEFTDIPIVMMANRSSASASEIVTGALQDHDRAYVVGETTFGKALVQSIYRISGGAGLALTTAHYYTPSGRLIQRPWDATFDEYLTYTMRDQDANKPHNAADLKRTDAGRPVYSGGGIEPDKRVAGPLEGFDPTRFGRALNARGEFANYAAKFTADGDTRVTQPSAGRRTVKPSFVVDDAMVADFREQLKADRVKIEEDAFKKDLDFIKAMIRFEIDRALYGVADARRHLIEVDPQARVALTMFGEAQKLSDLSRASSRAAQLR